MKKKNLITLIIALVLILAATFVVLYENGIFFNPNKSFSSDIFAVKDTSKITKIFMADRYGNTVTLTRTDAGWRVQDSLIAMDERVEGLLSIMSNVRIKNAVPLKAQSNINALLSSSGIKVEIFEKQPKFKLFGLKLGEKEKITKTYYMGPATQDNISNYAYLEGMDEPQIVHIPGFRGFITPHFSVSPYEWMTHNLFNTKITRIEKLEVSDYMNPEESFTVVKAGPRFFDLYNSNQQKIANYDTTKLIDMLSEYRDRNFEYIVNDLSQEKIDSIFQFNLWKTIALTDTEGEMTKMTIFKKRFSGSNSPFDYKQDVQKEEFVWDADRFYAIMNDDKATLYSMQFFHFGRQTQPLSYFLKDESGK